MKRLGLGVLTALILAACQNQGISPGVDAPPAAPTNLRVSQVTSSSVTLSWDAVSTASNYVVERKSGGSGYAPLATPTQPTYTDTSLSADTSYTYRVSASNDKGQSAGVEQTVRTTSATPVQFKIETVKTVQDTVWAMRFAPDGRLLFTQRDDTVVKVHALNLNSGNVTDYTGTSAVLNATGENGVLGLDLDPNFATNNKVYLCYTYGSVGNEHNRVSSFTLSGSSLSGEKALLEMRGGAHHNGCRVAFGPDDKLYVSMGDSAPAGDSPSGTDAQDLSILAGKIFRINPDGSIPSDNPFYSTQSGASRAIWSFGHRNPQGLAFQPGTGALWSTEHGPITRDELNIIKPGKNYGWPLCSGVQAYGVSLYSAPDTVTYPCTGPNLTAANYQPAVAEFAGGDAPTIAPSNLIFYTGNAFPAWKNDLFFVTLKTGRLYHLRLSGEKVASQEILINNTKGRLRDVVQGPDGRIYISTDEGLIFRLSPQ